MTREVIVALAMVVGLVGGACGSGRGAPAAPGEGTRGLNGPNGLNGSIAVDAARFPHGAHTGARPEIRAWRGRGLGCADCHDAGAVRQGRVARPGADQHAPCDDCHKAEFGEPPGKLCAVCHIEVDPLRPGRSPLQPYPARGAVQVLAASFSHRLHLDRGRMEQASGAHVACGDCHARAADTRDPQVPGHAACARCHESAARVKARLPMERCAGCHPARGVELVRGRRFITGDLRFAHATHERDASGAPVACTVCHVGVAASGAREETAAPPMVACAQCHEDSRKSPDRVRMSRCAVCHARIESGTPPMSHGGAGGARPSDHTLEFRAHHAEQAADPESRCRFCHPQVQGAREDSCFQCHAVMRPRDHNLLFRDDHGREAQADAARCASCHAPETCAACHSIPPRSHTPLGEFRLGGHAELARFGLSACLACHTYESTCKKCHRGTR